MSTSVQGRLTPADSVLILGTLAFTVFLIQWRQLAVHEAVLSAAGAVALYTAVVLMPKLTRQLVVQVTALSGLVANAQAVAAVFQPGAVTPPPVPSPVQVVEGVVVPDGQVRP